MVIRLRANVLDNTGHFLHSSFRLPERSGTCPGRRDTQLLRREGFTSGGPKDDVDATLGVDDVTDLTHLERVCGILEGLLHLPPPKGAYQEGFSARKMVRKIQT
jgi:hypothetical protein